MLEEIKEALMNNLKQQLEQRNLIDQEVKGIFVERNNKQKVAMATLSQIEQELESIQKNPFHRIIKNKKIIALCNKYIEISQKSIEEIHLLDEKIESSYQKIFDWAHNQFLIERQLERVKQATSLQELGVTEKQALDYIKNDEKRVIRAVFKDIKGQSIETSSDIDRNLNTLYQTNISPFVVAIQKISFSDLIKELVDIGIIVDEDKIKFINALKNYITDPEKMPYPTIMGQERTDRLDHNFYNQVQVDLTNMQHYHSYPPLAVSKIVTLAILVSIAKENKKKKQNQK